MMRTDIINKDSGMNNSAKRIICAVCAFVMCVLCFGGMHIASDAYAQETVSGEYFEIIEMLRLLKIADDTVSADAFDASATVSRGEFAQYAARMLQLHAEGYTELYYNDVPATFYAYDEITAMTKAGYMSGVGDKLFGPNEEMLTEYTYKIFLKALGLGKADAINNPDEGRSLCRRIGVLDGVTQNSGALTMGDLFKMIYNTLFTECYVTEGKDTVQGDRDFLEVTRNMKYVESGRVSCVSGMDLNNTGADDDVVIIDGVTYNAPSFNIDETLGRSVRFIYSISRRGEENEGTIIWIKPTSSDGVLNITVSPNCSFDKNSGKLSYIDEKGNDKSLYIPESITMIYNGRFREDNIKEAFTHARYDLTLIKSGSAYKTAVVWDYTNIVADEISSLDYSIKDKSSGDSIVLDSGRYEKMSIVGADGTEKGFDSIAKGDVLSVYTTYDKRYVKVVISSDKADDEIKAVYSADGRIELSNRSLEFYDGDFSAKADKLKQYIGKRVTFMLDARGFIADYELSAESSVSVGFLINASVSEDGLGGALRLKILEEDSNVRTMECTDTLRVNDVRYADNAQGAYSVLCGGKSEIVSQVIGYNKNADGKVTKIYTAAETAGGASPLVISRRLVKREGDTSKYDYAYYSKSSSRIGRLMAIGENTKIFIVPDDAAVKTAENKYFRVGSIEQGIYSNAISYRTTPEPTFFEQYVLIRLNSGMSTKISEYSAMFDCVIDSLDEDGYPVKLARIYNASGTVHDLVIDEDFDFEAKGYQRGDIFRYGLDEMTGKLTKTETIYQPSRNIITTIGTTTEEYRTLFGYVHSTDPAGIVIGYESGADEDEVLNMLGGGVSNVVIYDREKDEIISGTTADLKAYTAYGDDCSPVVAGTWYQAARNVFAHR